MPEITRRARLTSGTGQTSTTLVPYDKDNGHAGIIAPHGASAGWTTTLLVANRGYLARFRPSRNMTITNIAYAVTTFATNDDPVDVGIYSAALDLIVSSGATLAKLNTAIGVKSVTITSTPLVAGTTYYAALSCGAVGGTAATVGGVAWGATLNAQLFGATAGQVMGDTKATMHPLPAAWGALGTATANSVLFALRES
jgi:hypothetical protein